MSRIANGRTETIPCGHSKSGKFEIQFAWDQAEQPGGRSVFATIKRANPSRLFGHYERAIEGCDLDGFPNDSAVVRYLDPDREDRYRRFCSEPGLRSSVSALGGFEHPAPCGGGMDNNVAAGTALGSEQTQPRSAERSAPARRNARISLGGLTSVLAMLGLIAGLGYGGYALLQNIQRVGFAPLPEAPEVIAEAPLISLPWVESGFLRRPNANAYQSDGVLATTAPSELLPPVLPDRDGPISAIDPATSGLFRDRDPARDLVLSNGLSPTDTERSVEGEALLAAIADGKPVVSGAKLVPAGLAKVIVHATDTAWIQVRDGEAVVFQGTLAAGGQYEVPERITAPLLRAGNAGSVYVVIAGAPYGPLGSPHGVVKNLSLHAADVGLQVPQASTEAIRIDLDDDSLQSTEAALPH